MYDAIPDGRVRCANWTIGQIAVIESHMSKHLVNKKLAIALGIAAVLAGIFIAEGPFKSHATAIQFVLVFYALCVWAWRVMLPTAIALALWQYVLPANTVYTGRFGLGILVTGIALGIFWHLRHRKAIRKKEDPVEAGSQSPS